MEMDRITIVVLTFVSSFLNIPKETNASPKFFLIGGASANEGDFPWMATIKNEKGSAECGATIFHSNFLITAAHCFDSYYDNRQAPHIHPWTITLGQYDRSLFDERTIVENISEVFRHPNYDKRDMVNDIAIVKLMNEVQWSKVIQPARISGENFSQQKTATVAGWGWAFFDEYQEPNVLQFANMQIYPNLECYKILQEHSPHIRLHMSQMCAGTEGFYPQKGDSGGGLYAQIDGNWTVGGIVSYNIKYSIPRGNIPAVYTRVSSYKEWIWETCLIHL